MRNQAKQTFCFHSLVLWKNFMPMRAACRDIAQHHTTHHMDFSSYLSSSNALGINALYYFLSQPESLNFGSPVFAPACEHHHDAFPVCTGHLWDVAVDELMVLVHHKVFEVSRCQDSTLMAGCTVNSTGIHDLISPGLVKDSCSGKLRLFGKR